MELYTPYCHPSIRSVMQYATTLLNIPYRWHKNGDKISSTDKFWAENGPIVTAQYIKEHNNSIVCTGLINLMRRFMGLTIPGIDGTLGQDGIDFPGTTGIWFYYLHSKGRLQTIDINKNYPSGTLLIRNFRDLETDQGHVAVLYNQGIHSIMDATIIHAFAQHSYDESSNLDNAGFTGITPFKLSHYYHIQDTKDDSDGYYTHICLPENWLLID